MWVDGGDSIVSPAHNPEVLIPMHQTPQSGSEAFGSDIGRFHDEESFLREGVLHEYMWRLGEKNP